MAVRLALLFCVLASIAFERAAHARGVVLTIVNTKGKPLPDAVVWVDGKERAADSSGRVRVDGIDALENWEVWAPWYAATSIAVQVDDPKAIAQRTIVLEHGNWLSGRVIDPDGKPVPKASLVVMDSFGFHRATGEDDGRFSIPAVGPGKHRLIADSGSWIQAEQTVETDGLAVTAGVVLVLRRGATLDGVVVDGVGAPVAGAKVSARLGDITTDAAGKFTVDRLIPGSIMVQAKAQRGASALQQFQLVDGKHTTVRLVILDGSLAGTVVDTNGRPIANARVSASARLDEASKRDGAFGNTDAAGHFDLGGVVPGEYEIRAQRAGAEFERGKSAAVKATAGTRNVTLVIADGGGIKGRVIVDGKPARYFGFALAEKYIFKPVGTRTRDGRFADRDLTPGVWQLAIVIPGYVPKRLTPTIASNQTLDLGDLVMDRGRVLHGRVVDDQGVPVPGALVQINDGAFTPPEALWEQLDGHIATTTDEYGRFVLAGISPSQSPRIEARFGDTRSQRRVLQISGDNIELAVRPLGWLTGSIVGPEADWQKRRVLAQDLADLTSYYEVIADLDGRFDLPKLPVGDYRVYVDGRPSEKVTIKAGAKAQTTIGPRSP